jgi:hypothetical protein
MKGTVTGIVLLENKGRMGRKGIIEGLIIYVLGDDKELHVFERGPDFQVRLGDRCEMR